MNRDNPGKTEEGMFHLVNLLDSTLLHTSRALQESV